MILRKEFYFVRHGQTDGNKYLIQTDHGDISINSTGRIQAEKIAPLVRGLPFQTICCSPMKRAKETLSLIIPERDHFEIQELHECSAEVWRYFESLEVRALDKGPFVVRNFLERAKEAVNKSLEHPGPVLIVAHGGIHWAICYWLNIQGHDWIIDNCKPVHFFVNKEKNSWEAKLLEVVQKSEKHL